MVPFSPVIPATTLNAPLAEGEQLVVSLCIEMAISIPSTGLISVGFKNVYADLSAAEPKEKPVVVKAPPPCSDPLF